MCPVCHQGAQAPVELRLQKSGIPVSVGGGNGLAFCDEPAADAFGDLTRGRFRHFGRVLAIAANPVPWRQRLQSQN